jgi:hypothetical protein
VDISRDGVAKLCCNPNDNIPTTINIEIPLDQFIEIKKNQFHK